MSLRAAIRAILVFLLVSLPITARTGAAAERRPFKLVLLADRSDSICVAQRDAWKTAANRILPRLRPGDLIEIRAISDISDGAAPLFRGFYPVRPPGTGRKIDNDYVTALARFRRELLNAMKEAFGPPGGRKIQASDIFSTFRDVGAEAGMDSAAIYFSDMLHVDPKSKRGRRINLELMDLTAVKVSALLPGLADEYRWTSQLLQKTRVFVLLNDAALCPASTRNRIGDVRAFYGPLIHALGGELAGFSTVWKGEGL